MIASDKEETAEDYRNSPSDDYLDATNSAPAENINQPPLTSPSIANVEPYSESYSELGWNGLAQPSHSLNNDYLTEEFNTPVAVIEPTTITPFPNKSTRRGRRRLKSYNTFAARNPKLYTIY